MTFTILNSSSMAYIYFQCPPISVKYANTICNLSPFQAGILHYCAIFDISSITYIFVSTHDVLKINFFLSSKGTFRYMFILSFHIVMNLDIFNISSMTYVYLLTVSYFAFKSKLSNLDLRYNYFVISNIKESSTSTAN